MELKDRFLKYVSFDTQSSEESESFPSTEKQLVLLNYLADEMRSLGLEDVVVDKYGYTMGTIPASEGTLRCGDSTHCVAILIYHYILQAQRTHLVGKVIEQHQLLLCRGE